MQKLAAKQWYQNRPKEIIRNTSRVGINLQNKNEPTQKAIDSGYFEVVQGVKEKPNGENFTWLTPYVTPKGQAYIIDRLKKEQEQEAV
ncbi:phage antirepressor KilAC domain-containing protein [Chryseobacterium proteolyticum]|uniref:phage antirepressor KilAC domain-containing protein n=1 Tax=Chryseobacterium proteolyticum TaxID=118127 RepID=UPI0039831C90